MGKPASLLPSQINSILEPTERESSDLSFCRFSWYRYSQQGQFQFALLDSGLEGDAYCRRSQVGVYWHEPVLTCHSPPPPIAPLSHFSLLEETEDDMMPRPWHPVNAHHPITWSLAFPWVWLSTDVATPSIHSRAATHTLFHTDLGAVWGSCYIEDGTALSLQLKQQKPRSHNKWNHFQSQEGWEAHASCRGSPSPSTMGITSRAHLHSS